MNSKRAMALAVALVLALGLGSASAERLGRFGKTRKALSAKDFWATVAGWVGAYPRKDGGGIDPNGGPRNPEPPIAPTQEGSSVGPDSGGFANH